MKRNYTNPAADRWFEDLETNLAALPLSFTYNGVAYDGFDSECFTLDSYDYCYGRDTEQRTLTFILDGGLRIVFDVKHYFSHGVTEWTAWFENCSDTNSGIIENVKSELVFTGERPLLRGILGDHVNQYQPYSVDLTDNFIEYSSNSGRATHVNFPYFNLEHGEGGTMLAIGWAGTWTAQFSSDGENTVYTASSVNGLRTYLKPGEKIRTALFVIAPYSVRNEQYATNYWRDWFITNNLPKADVEGNNLTPFSTTFLAPDTNRPNSDGSISETYETWRPSMEKMLSEGIHPDFRWMDAGWYVAPDGTSAISYECGHDWWDTVGTWEFDPQKWPDKTFLESTDFARANGMKTLLWFEPERVTDPENLAKNYNYNLDWAIKMEGTNVISNNIGNPDCFRWTVDRIKKVLTENKIEMYREDNNCNARTLWDFLDNTEGENRQGITECKFIDAHYRMWDEIIECTKSFGGCAFVDSCASGGGRNDLDSMRRGIPLLRSDSDRTSTSLRLSITTSFNKWIPFCGAATLEREGELDATGKLDTYVWRASYLPALNATLQYVSDKNLDFDLARFGFDEWKSVSPYLLKEFYPLTPWRSKLNKTDFTAMAYFDPESESGVLLVFRQEDCSKDKITLSLPFISDGEIYQLTDEDSGETLCTGKHITLTLSQPRSAKIIWLNKQED